MGRAAGACAKHLPDAVMTDAHAASQPATHPVPTSGRTQSSAAVASTASGSCGHPQKNTFFNVPLFGAHRSNSSRLTSSGTVASGSSSSSYEMGGVPHIDFPKYVWTPMGGPYCYPRGWKKRTAIVSAGFVAVCTLVAWHCEKNTVRPMAPPTYPDRFHYKSDA